MTGGGSSVPRALPVAVVLLGFALCLDNAWVPFGRRVGVSIPDDAYYAFGVARHVAHGGPPSVDGVHPTNGFHPLWTALLVPIYAAFRGSEDLETPISVALTLGALFHALGGAFLWRITRRLGLGAGAGLVALAYYCGNAYAVANAVGGLESALATATALLAFLAFLRARAAPDDGRMPWLFGLACGAAILARTDQALLAAALFAAQGMGDRGSPSRHAIRRLLVAGGACAATLSPWLAYSWATTGSVVQSSGLALSMVHWRMPEAWGVPGGPALRLEQIGGCLAESYGLLGRALILGPFGLPALAALTGAGALLAARGSPPGGRLAGLAPFLAGLLALFAFHACARLSFREWYTSPFIAGAALLVGLNVDWIGRRIGRGPGPPLAAVAAMLALASPLYRGYAAWRSDGLWKPPDASPAWKPSTPPERVAHTDCGLAAYYATSGISNLDGLANQGAYEALRERRLLAYAREEGFAEIDLTASLRDAAFMGRGWRESVVSSGERKFRPVADPGEKDARIRARERPYRLAAMDGRELLGDGWIWPQRGETAVRSVGPSSELVFHLAARPGGGELVLEARAIAAGPGGVQTIAALLNGARVRTVALRPGEASRIAVPLAAAVAGRNRLRLEYGAPRAARSDEPGWYRSLSGNPALAIEASALSFPADGSR